MTTYVKGPFPAHNISVIEAGLNSGTAIVIGDDITVHEFRGQVYYTVVQA